MKLSQDAQQIVQAYDEFIDAPLQYLAKQQLSPNHSHRYPNHVLPRTPPHPTPPHPVNTYNESAVQSIDTTRLQETVLRLAMFQATYHDSLHPIIPDQVPIIIDSGASVSIMPHITDFISPPSPVQPAEIKGIASGLQIKGIGDITYTFTNDNGDTQTLLLHNCLYVPHCPVCLLCPCQIGSETNFPGDGFNSLYPRQILTIHGIPTTLHYDTISKLPVLYTNPGITSYTKYLAHLSCKPSTPPSTPALPPYLYENLSKLQRQKLFLHEKSNHEGFTNLNRWIKTGRFPNVPTTLADEPDPICTACAFAIARRQSHKAHVGHISKRHTGPGQGVSSDGMEAGVPGRPFTTKGLPSKKCLRYISFWIDHYSKYVYASFHETKASTELLSSKAEFESFTARDGVKIQAIRVNNGVYAAKCFCDSCMKQKQDLTFCAVGAHWQNGITERFIGTMTEKARTILLHAMHKWPTMITEDMWPYAICHAINFHNSSIHKDSDATPHTLFTGEDPPTKLDDFRVFGCPTYILDKHLQDGTKINKWKSCSWQGIYISTSSYHASHIPLNFKSQNHPHHPTISCNL